MNILQLAEILGDLVTDTYIAKENESQEISGIEFDSRKIQNGYIFCAVKGVKTDGHLFIDKACELGASAFICEDKKAFCEYSNKYPDKSFVCVKDARRALALSSKHFYECACDKLKIIGITGTKGKTSTSFMLSSVLSGAGIKVGIIGTNGAYFGTFYEELSHSTPESRDLHRLFFKMHSMGATHIVMEVSSQAILMSRVYGISFDTAIFTNISPDHIGEGEHPDFENYLYCKSRLFTMCKNALVNADSDKAETILEVCARNGVNVTTFACKEKADFTASDIEFLIDKRMYTNYVCTDKKGVKTPVSVGVPGKFSVFNSLCALSCARLYGVSYEAICKALLDVKVVGRIEPVHNDYCKAPVIIDYAHNEVSMESLFEAMRAYSPRKIICVFGCGGNRSKLRRYEMGESSGKNADLSVITTDNSRFEELDDIIADILVGIKKTDGEYVIIKDRTEAIHYAMSKADRGDVVLLVGKGQETYLDIKGVKTHYDEREAVALYKGE